MKIINIYIRTEIIWKREGWCHCVLHMRNILNSGALLISAALHLISALCLLIPLVLDIKLYDDGILKLNKSYSFAFNKFIIIRFASAAIVFNDCCTNILVREKGKHETDIFLLLLFFLQLFSRNLHNFV